MTYQFRVAAILGLTFAFLGCTAGMMTVEQAQQVYTGMSAQRVIEAVGKPAQVNVTRTRGTVREQWVYRTPQSVTGLSYKRVYVYVQGGEVTGVQY